MSRPKRDETAKPVPRDQILRRERGQGNVIFPCSTDHGKNWQLTRLIHTLLHVTSTHTYIQWTYYAEYRQVRRQWACAISGLHSPPSMKQQKCLYLVIVPLPRSIYYAIVLMFINSWYYRVLLHRQDQLFNRTKTNRTQLKKQAKPNLPGKTSTN